MTTEENIQRQIRLTKIQMGLSAIAAALLLYVAVNTITPGDLHRRDRWENVVLRADLNGCIISGYFTEPGRLYIADYSSTPLADGGFRCTIDVKPNRPGAKNGKQEGQ